jgi:23S rRNA pseudouridine1911/1915/1917 synthase
MLAPTAESRAFRPETMALPVLFEDEHLLVLNKPAGWVVHPAAGNWQGTLLNGLLAWHSGAAALPRAGIVHRLDKGTSGLMVVGKTLQAVTALTRAIAARQVQRHYLAIAHGNFPTKRASIELPLGRDPRSRVRMAVVRTGKSARTEVERLASTAVDQAHGRECMSALRCKLHTGRTHQIRVHLASRGHPLAADILYGGRSVLGMHRPALHAVSLSLAHPHCGHALSFQAPPPEDFAQAWDSVLSQAGVVGYNARTDFLGTVATKGDG